MLRVKDPKASLAFYCEVLGVTLLMHKEYPLTGFDVYIVAPVDPATGKHPAGVGPEKASTLLHANPRLRGADVELREGGRPGEQHRNNTGNDDCTGTQDRQKVRGGFGHVGITVPDVYDACKRFAELGCEFAKTPNAGKMKVRSMAVKFKFS
jgi:lactoylglutathione lyase